MNQCRECYKNFRGYARISLAGKHISRGVFIITHPDVTEEEVNEWIVSHLGALGPSNWGAVEVKPNMKLWFNCQNDD